MKKIKPKKNNKIITFKLSNAQRRMFVLYKLEPNSPFYNINNVKEIKGDFKIDKFQKSINIIVRRHEVFRTNFKEINGEPVQIIKQKEDLKSRGDDLRFKIYDLRGIKNCKEKEDKEIDIIKSITQKSFNLEKDSLLRVAVIKKNKKKHSLIISMHHIISDDWSMNIFYKELAEIYKSLLEKRKAILPKLFIQYKDYAEWEQSKINAKRLKKQEKFWLKELSGELPVLNLPTDKPRLPIQTYEGSTEYITLDLRTTKKLKDLVKQNNTTLFTLLFTIFNVFLYRITGQEDIVVGMPSTDRNYKEVENNIGLFVNTLAVRTKINQSIVFRELLDITKDNFLKIYNNKDYPFEHLVKKLNPHRDMSRKPLFNVLFQIFHLNKNNQINKLNNARLEFKSNKENITKFDITMRVIERVKKDNKNNNQGEAKKTNIILNCEYNTDLFENKTIKNFLRIMEVLIVSITKNPSAKLNELEIVSKKERKRLLYEFNNTKTDYPKDKTIYQLFEEQVKKTPNNIAVEFEGQKLSYNELNERANQLAHYLSDEKKVKQGQVISVFLERSIDTVVSILAVLKTGASYVPIDTSYPKQRIDYIIKDTKSPLIITCQKLRRQFSQTVQRKLLLVDLNLSSINKEDTSNLKIKPDVRELACLIYTSGSTGRPKGVILTQGGIVNYVYTKINALKRRKRLLSQKDIFCQTAPIGYVISIWQMFSPLVIGAKLIIYPDRLTKDSNIFFSQIDKDKISLIQIVPSFLLSYLDIAKENNRYSKLSSLKEIQLTGEPTPPFLVNTFYIKHKTPLVNVYGSSEMSDDALHYEIANKTNHEKVFAGKPIIKDVYILDANLRPRPIGFEGELFIGGNNLSKGYLNDPEKTKKVFLLNPFKKNKSLSENQEQIMYKTGDLAKMHEDGNIEILCRIDHQVNIHGNRIELGEIEVNLQKHEGVKRCIVVSNKDKNIKESNVLVAYYTSINKKKQIKTETLRNHLKKILPDYMIPTYFIHLQEFPLNQNGKLDRLSLPEPKEKDLEKNKYTSPKTEIEKKLSKIWREVLNIKKISRNDNFFNLGGHSLKAIQVLSRMNSQFKIDLGLKEIFKRPTIQEISESVDKEIKKKNKAPRIIIPKTKQKKYYSLSYAQRRMFVLYKLEPDSVFYNINNIRELKGNFRISEFKKAINVMVARHESFRTNFKEINGDPVQIIKKSRKLKINNYELKKDKDQKQQINKIIKKYTASPFKLETDPLLRVAIIEQNKNNYILIISIHHIISDGWSMNIFYKELIKIYNASIENKKAILPKLFIQYKDYAEWEQSKENKKRLEKQEKYWIRELSRELPVLNLPTDKPRLAVQTYKGSTEKKMIDKKIVKRINSMCKKTDTTSFNLMMTVFNIFLHRITNQNDIIVGTFVANRNYSEIQNSIGCFLNNLSIRSDLSKNIGFIKLLKQTKKKVINATENGEYPFEQLIERLNLNRDMSRSPIFNVVFQYDEKSDNKNLFDNLKTKLRLSVNETTKFDIKIRAIETNFDAIVLSCEYNNDLFNQETIVRFLKIFKNIVESVVTNPKEKISKIELVSNEEKYKLVNLYNNTKTNYPKNKTLHELFEEQVKRTPKNIAVEFEKEKLTYQELNEKANRLAHYLRNKKKLKLNNVIGVAVDRSLDLAIATIAVHKAGGACLLMDSRYPKKRMGDMLSNSKAKIILVSNDIQKRKNAYKKVSDILNINSKEIAEMANDNLKNYVKPKDSSYIFFTSGSTGVPKGVEINHGGVVNQSIYRIRKFKITNKSVLCLSMNTMFIPMTFMFYTALFSGSKLCIYPLLTIKEPKKLFTKINDDRVILVDIPYQIFKSYTGLISKNLEERINFKHLKFVLPMGETIDNGSIKIFLRNYNKIKLVYNYGGTEMSGPVVDGFIVLKNNKIKFSSLRPTQNNSIYILNQDKKIQPIGIPGELYMSGAGLSNGYINNPQRTKQVFLPHPFIKGEKIYKTGDLAKMHPDGNIEILGRVDHQIKIRGYRIEPGEIETNLKKHNNIKDVVVMAKEIKEKQNKQKENKNKQEQAINDKYLVAYYTSNNRKKISSSELKEKLKQNLPDYMIPNYFVYLEQFPLNQNGKLDRLNLPEPKEKDLDKNKYLAPKNEIEKKVAKIWQEVLSVKKISRNDNFFNLGGHSLKAIQVVAKINEMFKIEVSLKNIFVNSILSEFSQMVDDEIIKKHLLKK